MLKFMWDRFVEIIFPALAWIQRGCTALWNLKDTRFGRMIGWTALAGTLTYIASVFKAGLAPALVFFQQVASDPQAAFSGLPEDGILSLGFVFDGLSEYVPDALRWFFWFVGGDWWVWLVMSGLALWFAGFLLEKLATWMGAIVERVCQLL